MLRSDLSVDGAAAALRIALAVSDFNRPVSDGLLAGALAALEEAGVGAATVARVPGAFELPLAAAKLIVVGHDAVVALGAVIKGETDHYEFIAAEAARGIMDVGLRTGVPVAFGVLTVRDAEHAIARSVPGPANKGAEAARAAVEAALAIQAMEKLGDEQ